MVILPSLDGSFISGSGLREASAEKCKPRGPPMVTLQRPGTVPSLKAQCHSTTEGLSHREGSGGGSGKGGVK